MTRSRILLVLTSLLVGIIGGSAHASPLVLTDGASSVTIDPTAGGVDSWTINGKENMDNEWFWLRIGSGTAAQKLGSTGTTTIDFNTGQVAQQTFTVAGNYEMKVLWQLNNIGGGNSQLSETLTLKNLGATRDFHLFEFTDFDLYGAQSGSAVPTTSGGKYLATTQTSSTGAVAVVGINAAFPANRYEATIAHGTLLDTSHITNPSGYDLANTAGRIPPSGFGDVEFAFQWDLSLAHDQSIALNKTKTIDFSGVVPETGSMILFGLGILGVGLVRRSRRL